MNLAQKRLKIWGLIGGLVLIPCHTAMGQCAVLNILKGDFRSPDPSGTVRRPWYADGEEKGKYGWVLNGSARFDARFDNVPGWKDLHQSVSLLANKGYELTAVVRTSPNMREGYLGFGGASLPKHVVTQFGPQTGFKTVRVTFTPLQAGSYDVFIGFWARDKEAFIEVSAVSLVRSSGGCDDVHINPDQ
jgi:hypothetical protein